MLACALAGCCLFARALAGCCLFAQALAGCCLFARALAGCSRLACALAGCGTPGRVRLPHLRTAGCLKRKKKCARPAAASRLKRKKIQPAAHGRLRTSGWKKKWPAVEKEKKNLAGCIFLAGSKAALAGCEKKKNLTGYKAVLAG
jgi:hypothetical protein